MSGAAGKNFAIAALHSTEADRRERKRQRRRFTENGGLGAAIADIVEDALAKRDALQTGAVGMQRLLGIGAGLGIIDEGARDLAVGELPQVLNAGDCSHPPSTPGTTY